MRYASFVIDSISGSATSDESNAIDAFNERLVTNGHWIMAAGITAPDAAMVFDHRGEELTISPGSIFHSKEFAAAGSKACNRKVELRPFVR